MTEWSETYADKWKKLVLLVGNGHRHIVPGNDHIIRWEPVRLIVARKTKQEGE